MKDERYRNYPHQYHLLTHTSRAALSDPKDSPDDATALPLIAAGVTKEETLVHTRRSVIPQDLQQCCLDLLGMVVSRPACRSRSMSPPRSCSLASSSNISMKRLTAQHWHIPQVVSGNSRSGDATESIWQRDSA